MTEYHRGYTERGADTEPAGTPIWFTASTPGVKRDGLDLRAQGWRLDEYRANPVMLWCHDRTRPPIGNVLPETGDRLRAGVLFDQEDDFARKVESKYRRGFLHAVSVGWDFVDKDGARIDARRMSVERIRDHAFYSMTELSGVPVPADPDALMERQRAGLRSLGRELVDLFDEQENEHSDVTADDIRTAVIAELDKLGVPIPAFQRHQPAEPAGLFVPTEAARALLGAFDLEGNR
jgi:hypothetical protein